MGPRRLSRQVVALVLLGAVIRLGVAAFLPILEAESYYWLWSQRLDWGFTDHPPMVAALMRAFGWIGGHGALGVRLGSVVAATVGAFVFHAFACRVAGPRAAWASLVFIVVAPLWAPFGIVATPDGPLLLFWTVSLYLFWRAYQDHGWVWWLGAGAATGLAILSKYNGFQLPLVFLAFLLVAPKGRGLLRGPRPWAAVAVALLVAAPNLMWNAEHGGRAFATPFDGMNLGDVGKHLALFVLLPFAVLTPLIGYAWQRVSFDRMRAGREERDETFLFLCCASWVPFLMFGAVAVVTAVGAHWVAPCFVAAVPLALSPLDGPDGTDRQRSPARPGPRFLRAGVWVAGLLMAALLVAAVGLRLWARSEAGAADASLAAFPDTKPPRGLTRAALELRGWDELGERLEREIDLHREGAADDRPPFIVSTNFHLVARAQYLLEGRVPGLPTKERERNNYEIWQGRGEALVGRDAICVEKYPRLASIERLHFAFRSVTALPPVAVRVGDRTIHRFSLYLCRDFRRYPPDLRLVDLPPEGDAREDQSDD